jgi:predicted fused transcriptional regulator/phosphomethylpyrimidine kinase
MARADRDASFIALQHDIHPATNAAYVKHVVKYAKAMGKRIVRIDECLGAPDTAYVK